MIFAKIKTKELNSKFVQCLENLDVSVEEFEDFLETEEQFTACRKINNDYYGSGFAAIEFFETWNVDEIMKNPFIKDNASFVIKMGSEEENNFIVIFCLEEPLLDKNKHGKILQKLQTIFPRATVNNPEHVFLNYGLSSTYAIGNILSRNSINLMIGSY